VVADNRKYVLQRTGQFATDLHAAVISQDLGALKQLNHKGADLSAKNQVCYPPLHVADLVWCPQLIPTIQERVLSADT